AWTESSAPVLAYLDVDLSTDLAALLPLVAPLASGHSDLAIGTRLARGSRTVRGPKREVISRCYNLILRGSLRARFSDAQCGFKAIRKDVAQQLLPLVKDEAWFFDTELLVLAERSGLRIHEVPVDWVDDPDSRVDIVSTAVEDLRGVARVGSALMRGQLPLPQIRAELGRPPLSAGLVAQVVRFAGIGVVSTLAYLALYAGLRGGLGAQLANLVALLVTAVGNTAANRRLTFGVRGRVDAVKHQSQGLAVFAVGLLLTSGSLALLHAALTAPPVWLELGILVVANLVATLVRFLLLRRWVFGRPTSRGWPSQAAADAPARPGS
ncbi:MAG: GtrA family protein, partial [Actinomycetota bacterium]|nr:GtrA family protein [Actinomycetota bacterium]